MDPGRDTAGSSVLSTNGGPVLCVRLRGVFAAPVRGRWSSQGFECAEAGRGENWTPRDLTHVQGVGRGQLPTPVSALGVTQLVRTVSSDTESGRMVRLCFLFYFIVFYFIYLLVFIYLFIYLFIYFFIYLFLAVPRGIQDLSSPTRDQTCGREGVVSFGMIQGIMFIVFSISIIITL